MPKNNHERNVAPMQEAKQRQSAQKIQILKDVLDDMISCQGAITVTRVCELSGLSKSFLYKNEDAKKLFETAKNTVIPVPKKNKHDLLLQYEELKRKLHESYFLQAQLLSSENEHLKEEIADLELQVNYLKSSPKFSVQFKADDSIKDEFFTFHIESLRGNKTFNPVGEAIIENLLWGDYVINSSNLKFDLESQLDGVILEKATDGYLLTISDSLKETITINIIVKKLTP